MPDESSRRYLFVVIDRATRWVFVQLKANKTAASAQAFLHALHKACPIKINKLFTDRLFASCEREPSCNHEFDQLCQALGIVHRLTKPRTPRTNEMVERLPVAAISAGQQDALAGNEGVVSESSEVVSQTAV